MNYVKLLPVFLLALTLAACGQQEQGAEETMDEAVQKTEEAAEEVKEGAEEMTEEVEESDAWEKTKERAKEAWVATKEFSMEAWEKVRESFKGDMTAEEKQAFDDCVARLQKVEGLTEDQAERGCWRMMEEDTVEEYYAEEPDSDHWSSLKKGAEEAWQKTKEGAKEAWTATKEYSQEAWTNVRESFIGDMTPEQKKAFDDCVAKLQKEEGLTKDQAERGCWKMMKEGTLSAYLSGGEEESAPEGGDGGS